MLAVLFSSTLVVNFALQTHEHQKWRFFPKVKTSHHDSDFTAYKSRSLFTAMFLVKKKIKKYFVALIFCSSPAAALPASTKPPSNSKTNPVIHRALSRQTAYLQAVEML